MDLVVSDVQLAIRNAVREYCRDRYSLQTRIKLLRGPDGYSREYWKDYARMGWLAAALPETSDRLGETIIETAIILEEFGSALVLEPYLPCAVLAGQLLAAGGENCKAVLTSLIEGGSLIAPAFAWVDSQLSTFGSVHGTRITGGWLLSGRYSLVLGGSNADKLLVAASLSDEPGGCGTAIFLLDSDRPGIERSCYRLLDGSGAADFTFRQVTVKEACVVVCGQAALDALENAVDHAIVGQCAMALGAMDDVLWTTRDYLKTRRQLGSTLSSLQALQHRMADMLIEVEMARSALYRALASFVTCDRHARRRALLEAKYQVCQSAKLVAADGVQLHGGIGVTNEHKIGQHFKQLTVLRNLFGGADDCLRALASAEAQ